ncbi:Acg family FMN-binding oxidoreductase [Promicromonospora sp. NPDC019610]|uniref:Acg family FMN-binding oxidoreductase n=1 Tax=Promicromonospora sp. NPDC019610 TaxID=3364405 RepID=UPI0037B7098B
MDTDLRVRRILQAAVHSPSVLNTQPWRVHTSGRTVTLHADPARQLLHSDPSGREMLISCGAFLFTTRTAARRESMVADVSVLPDPDDKLLVATIELRPGRDPNAYERELALAIERRRTTRAPFEDQPLFSDVLHAVEAAAHEEGAELRVIQHSEPARDEVVRLVRRAEALAAEDPVAREEELAWTATAPDRDDGIPQDLLGPRPADERVPVRRFLAGAGSVPFEQHSTMAVLTTPDDTARDWIAAGQALENVLLVATTYFVRASFATTVLENPTTRHDLRRALTLDAAPQMVMRLGYGKMPGHTPRRPVTPSND